MKPLTQELVRELFDYNHETGVLSNKKGRQGLHPKFIGKPAGCDNGTGSLVVRLNNRLYLVHHIVWLYLYGKLPSMEIDHKNLDRSDNREDNLRSATRLQNNLNKSVRSDSLSGLKGAFFDKNKNIWYSRIHINGKKKWLGSFKTKEEAHAAYVVAARYHYGQFARAS